MWKPVNSDESAAPIALVFKRDGSIRIFGDHKHTVNQVAGCDKYPVPNTDDTFTTLCGVDKFSKLDLSQAYRQLLLSPDSRELLTVNTGKGLLLGNSLTVWSTVSLRKLSQRI